MAIRVLGAAAILVVFSVAAAAMFHRAPLAEACVSPNGSDSASGTADEPFQSLAHAVARVRTGGVIHVQAGLHAVSGEIAVTKSLTIRGDGEQTPELAHGDFRGPILLIEAPNVALEGLVLDGGFKSGSRGIRASGASRGLVIKNCEVRSFTDHAIDVDGPETLIENCEVHHNLLMQGGERVDAHGIVSKWGTNLTIRGCNVHHCSGDAFQAERGAWQDILIERCDFWDGPLEKDMAGFNAGDYVSENAIDTKREASQPTGRIVLRHNRFHGFRCAYINNSAATNLKENCDVVVDGCEISDSEVGMRIRGYSKGAKLKTTVVNCTILDCDVAVRHEDRLEDFVFAHNTIASSRQFFVRAPKSSPWGMGWKLTNNLLVGLFDLPEEARSGKNLTVPLSDVDSATLRLRSGKDHRGEPLSDLFPTWYKEAADDRDGKPRSKTAPVVGPFEIE